MLNGVHNPIMHHPWALTLEFYVCKSLFLKGVYTSSNIFSCHNHAAHNVLIVLKVLI